MPFYHLIFSAFLCTENQELKNLSLRSEVKGVKADTLSRMPSVLRSIGFVILTLMGTNGRMILICPNIPICSILFFIIFLIIIGKFSEPTH